MARRATAGRTKDRSPPPPPAPRPPVRRPHLGMRARAAPHSRSRWYMATGPPALTLVHAHITLTLHTSTPPHHALTLLIPSPRRPC
eukprot:2665059-Prymnesium_polylepis.1